MATVLQRRARQCRGMAAMLEVARAAAAAPDKPRRSMIFLATTAEENGLLGADYFAHNPTVPHRADRRQRRPRHAVAALSIHGRHRVWRRIIRPLGGRWRQAVAPMAISLSPDPMPEQGVFTRSDHYQLVRQGVPAVFLATGMANGGGQVLGRIPRGRLSQPAVMTFHRPSTGTPARNSPRSTTGLPVPWRTLTRRRCGTRATISAIPSLPKAARASR